MNRIIDEPDDSAVLCRPDDSAHRVATRPKAASAEVIARAAGMLGAAGDPARLRLLELLAAGERCVSDIATTTGDAMPTVSQRLQLLRREGLLRSRRDGKHVFYALADAHVLELIDNVLRHAAEGS
jgi:DNA-binding transcriptional ArsR family regulator